jgi:uncharacterized protein YcbK (DUF882 family)
MPWVSNEELFPVWREPRSVWERTGLTAAQRHYLDLGLASLVVLLLFGWTYTAADALRTGDAPQIARRIAANPTPFSPNAPPNAAFLIDAALRQLVSVDELRGHSGEVRVVVRQPGEAAGIVDSLPAGVQPGYRPIGGADTSLVTSGSAAPEEPGLWNVLLQARGAIRAIPDISLVTLVPRSTVRGGRLGSYRLGSWPEEKGIYTPPSGFVRVTQENMNTYVSEHIQLKDFLTKGQEGVWPKYVAMSTLLLDKLELTFQELEREGHPVTNVFAVSGFRTPSYNESGGDPSGRAGLSRHMYGDAMDVAIDNDHDGLMDDLNGDGRVNTKDARILALAAQRVEQKYPDLVGGIGIYAPTGGHHGFVHVDTRGYRARWGAW